MEILYHKNRLNLIKQVFRYLFETVFNLTLVGHTLAKSYQVQFKWLKALQRLWHVLVFEPLQDPVNQACFSHSCFAHNENIGPVFPSQNLDDG